MNRSKDHEQNPHLTRRSRPIRPAKYVHAVSDTRHPSSPAAAGWEQPSYAFDFDPPDNWAARIAPYLSPASPERLVIGRFCQIANGVRIITASANHRHDGISSYPFAIFDGTPEGRPSMPTRFSDTVIGNDVWLGDGAVVMPGARIGSGVIVGARAVVSGEVPDYAVVAGNPGRVIRHRFAPEDIVRLMALAWWDWPIDRILAHEAEICGGDVDALERVAREA